MMFISPAGFSLSLLKRYVSAGSRCTMAAAVALSFALFFAVAAQAASAVGTAQFFLPSNAAMAEKSSEGSAARDDENGRGRVIVMPRDEAHRDLSLIKFREKLKAIVRKRDSEALESCLSKDVLVGLGGGVGIDNFYEVWKPEHNREFWTKLDFALSHGGYFESDSQTKFTAPYCDFFPESEAVEDSQIRAVILAPDAELCERPNGAVIGHLSYDLVHLLDDTRKSSTVKNGTAPSGAEVKAGAGWRHVVSFGGKSGFVRDVDLYSQTEPIAEFARHGNKWFLSAFGSASP